GGAANQAPRTRVLEHEEIALFTIEADLGSKGGLGGGDLVAQATGIIRQRGDAYRAVGSKTLHFGKVGHLRGAQHQHGLTPSANALHPRRSARKTVARQEPALRRRGSDRPPAMLATDPCGQTTANSRHRPGRSPAAQPRTSVATARSKRSRPSSMSASSITRLGAKRRVSGPACSTSTPSAVAASSTSLALPCQTSLRAPPSSKPRPRISRNRPYCSPIACRRCLKRACRVLTPPSTAGVLTISSTASASAQARGLPP